MNNHELCEATGIIIYEDGSKEYCDCEAGKKKEMLDEVITDDMGEQMTKGEFIAEKLAENVHND